MGQFDALLEPITIRDTTIRNRTLSTGHAPGYGLGGMPAERYQLYHEEKAKGGIGLTIFGGTTTFCVDSPAIEYNSLYAGTDDIIPYFKQFADLSLPFIPSIAETLEFCITTGYPFRHA